MMFDYPGGIPDEQKLMVEHFESDVVPYLRKHGPAIGEKAMQGDAVATEAIIAYRLFVEGIPELRADNYKRLCNSLKAMEATRT